MKYAIQMCALVGAVVVAAPQFALAQAPAALSVKAEMLKDWSGLKDTMTKIANEMPADKFNAKPTPAQQSFAERVVHIAQVNNRFLGAVGGTAKAPAVDAKAAAMTKEAAIKAMQDSFDYGTALLNEQTDQSVLQAAAMPPPFLGPSTRARLYTFLIGHTWDIYGQMVVYLRLNGGVPPASQRP
jgi:uncharacterized damage-inducible protein DinB